MTTILSIAEARDQLLQLADELADTSEIVTITKHSKPVMAVLPYELYESLIEMLAILSDEETAAALRRGIANLSEGQVQDADEVFAELGW